MSFSSIGSVGIDLAGAQGPAAVASQIAARIGDGSSTGSPVALDLEVAMIEKGLQTAQAISIDLRV